MPALQTNGVSLEHSRERPADLGHNAQWERDNYWYPPMIIQWERDNHLLAS